MKNKTGCIMENRVRKQCRAYYGTVIIIMIIIGWTYMQVKPIFEFEKMLFIFSIGGLFHQGIYYCLSSYNHVQTLTLSCTYALIELVVLFLCIQDIPHYLYYNTLDVQYKEIAALMFIPIVVLFSFVRKERKKNIISVFSIIKQIILVGGIFAIIYVCLICSFADNFNLDRANKYFAMQEKAGFIKEEESLDENNNKFKAEEIKQVESIDSIKITLTKDGRVHISELTGTLFSEVETWKNVAFISCGKTHILGLTFDGVVLAAGEGFFGQTDVKGLSDIEYIYAADWKSYLITAEGKFIVVGSECKEADYDKLTTLYELVKE